MRYGTITFGQASELLKRDALLLDDLRKSKGEKKYVRMLVINEEKQAKRNSNDVEEMIRKKKFVTIPQAGCGN